MGVGDNIDEDNRLILKWCKVLTLKGVRLTLMGVKG